jgi:hypothetical protein
MKLYELNRGSHFKLLEKPTIPAASPMPMSPDLEYKLGSIDGMYSWSIGEDGETYYFAAWTEVEEV